MILFKHWGWLTVLLSILFTILQQKLKALMGLYRMSCYCASLLTTDVLACMTEAVTSVTEEETINNKLK